MASRTFACNVQRAQKDARRRCLTMFPANFVVPGTRDFIPLRSDIILGVCPSVIPRFEDPLVYYSHCSDHQTHSHYVTL